MIGNNRQLGTARRKLAELQAALEEDVSIPDRSTLAQLAADVGNEIAEYESIRDGLIQQFPVASVDDLGEAAIKARVARGLNQRELAAELGVTEQAVQRDEATFYERAGLAKLAEVFDVLEHQLIGLIRPMTRAGEAQIIAYSPAIQGRVPELRGDSSWWNGVSTPVRCVAESSMSSIVSGRTHGGDHSIATQNRIKVGPAS